MQNCSQVKWQEPVLHFLRAHLPHLQITRWVLFVNNDYSKRVFQMLRHLKLSVIVSRYILPAFASTPQSEGSSSAASLPPSSDPVSVTRFITDSILHVTLPLPEPSAALSFSRRLLHSWVPHFLKRYCTRLIPVQY